MKFKKQPVKNKLFLTGFFILAFLVSGCDGQSVTSVSFEGETMGTTYHITVIGDMSAEKHEVMQKDIDELLTNINQSFSTYIESSEVSTFNQYDRQDATVKSADFIYVLSEALRISHVSQGAYDITVGPLVNLWGFGPSFTVDSIPSDDDVSNALSTIGYQKIELDEAAKTVKKLASSIYIDFSSIAKGFGVDKVAALLEKNSRDAYMVEIGGEMRVKGVNPLGDKWRIAVEKPDSRSRSIHRVINVTDIAIATSGDYRNFFELDGVRFSHTIDPKTGQPVQHDLASVTVLAKDAMTADAWATAFMVLGEKKGYDLAIKNKLAVLFLVQENGQMEEIITPAFQNLIGERSL